MATINPITPMAASVTATAQKILLPMIRKVYPNLIANQILNVQPLTGRTGSIFDVSWRPRKYNTRYWPYQFMTVHYNTAKIERWCWNRFKGRYWHSHFNKFVFKNEADAILFKLTWATEAVV